ncbi:MAG: hypothetical protein SPJ78_04780 [Corynebacterium camporealensis]|nr:hypothetical protein [Corynebacterium camporealensis]
MMTTAMPANTAGTRQLKLEASRDAARDCADVEIDDDSHRGERPGRE